MEFRIQRGVLVDAVTAAARSLPARSPVPVLGGLLLTAGEGLLRISGFDYEVAATVEVPAETVTPGQVLVLGRRLLDVCKVLPETAVSCALEGARFTVEGGGTRFGLSTLPREEYPALPKLPEPRGVVDAGAFAEAVAQVVIAAGRDESLPVLTGVGLRLDGPGLTLTASDRYRYAVRTLEWKPDAGNAGEEGEAVVPGRRLADIARSLAGSGLVRVGLGGPGGTGGGLISFEGAGMRTTVRLLDGRLPRHDKLFALKDPAVAVVPRARLADAVRRVAVVAEPNSPVRLDFSARGTVLLQAGYEDDVAAQEVAADLTGAQDVAVAFNPAYLADALGSFTAPQVRFELLGPGQRALLSGVTAQDDTASGDHRHLLMSVRQSS